MTQRTYASFESLRKQAKKLVRLVSAGDPDALARVHAQWPAPTLPLSLRDAQLVVARELGFGGWGDLRAAVLRQEGEGLEWAASEAERAIHDHQVGRLAALVQEYPALLTWRDEAEESLLDFATGSFGDSGDPHREQMFTRLDCAELLLDAGAVVMPENWEGAIRARANGVLQLLARKAPIPRRLDVLAALGEEVGVRNGLAAASDVTPALFAACHFGHRAIARLLLDRCVELNPALGEKIDRWQGRDALIDYLIEHPRMFGDPWQSMVVSELFQSIVENDLDAFGEWLSREPDLLGEAHLELQVDLIETATWNDRAPFVTRLLELLPTLRQRTPPPPSSALEYAFEYGNDHLIPLLTSIWPLPDDLCHSAGVGDFAKVKAWFDDTGQPKLGSLSRQYPTDNPRKLRHLRWHPAHAQHVLDTAFAWSCLNHHFEIAAFLLERGANVNTDWSTHEPASILHECAVHGNYEAAQFLIDHGVDMTLHDYRWNATPEGWAYYAAHDEKMAEFLANAKGAR